MNIDTRQLLNLPTNYSDKYEPYEEPERIKVSCCPFCGSGVRLELSINYLVCKGCQEFLYANELV
jgi:hypothetical protein